MAGHTTCMTGKTTHLEKLGAYSYEYLTGKTTHLEKLGAYSYEYS